MQITRTGATTSTPSSEWVTGTVHVTSIAVAEEAPSRLRIDDVRFEPGSRTHWHRHPEGQFLHITEGAGLMQRRGGPVEVVRAGDRVHIAPGEWHWHGAGPTTSMTHLAVLTAAEDGTEAERGEPVTDACYPSEPVV
ncbi:cupin domain-containing protein [Streptomyces sp. VNUA116]|uniref:cupin domain-containing protein n=1 Tax=Streptomyces sp. VNUA116 TaxID=3062449 RepID=UPI0026758784|nr:cupin domain-containing protein [Streptomyces sp. VNUA116]WKU46551.1 cupin domain-containing protein [Streptomyces sp. VNUA116]